MPFSLLVSVPPSVFRLSLPRLALSLLPPYSLSVLFPDSPGPTPSDRYGPPTGPPGPGEDTVASLDTSQGIAVFIPTVQMELRLGTIR